MINWQKFRCSIVTVHNLDKQTGQVYRKNMMALGIDLDTVFEASLYGIEHTGGWFNEFETNTHCHSNRGGRCGSRRWSHAYCVCLLIAFFESAIQEWYSYIVALANADFDAWVSLRFGEQRLHLSSDKIVYGCARSSPTKAMRAEIHEAKSEFDSLI